MMIRPDRSREFLKSHFRTPDIRQSAVWRELEKSTFLKTMLFSLIRNRDPRQLQFYVLDYSDGYTDSV